MKRLIALLAAIGTALVTCSAALANALDSGHGATSAQGGNFGQGGTAGVNTNGVGTLPFTGLNLALVAAVAVLLVASGLVLHRMTRRQQ